MATTPTADLAPLGIEALAGSAREIRERLEGAIDDRQIVAFRLDQGGKVLAAAVADAFRVIAPMIVRTIKDHEIARLEKLVDALVPDVALPEHLLTEARMNAEARRTVLADGPWLTAARLSNIAGYTGQNASAQPNKWKREGKIFALRHDGVDLYPGYALDAGSQYRPLKALAPILKLFGDHLDAWDVAIWFASASSFLGGKTPKTLLKSDPERVLAAAEDEMAGVLHG